MRGVIASNGGILSDAATCTGALVDARRGEADDGDTAAAAARGRCTGRIAGEDDAACMTRGGGDVAEAETEAAEVAVAA